MKPYYEHAGITIYHGDCREMLHRMAFDVIVSDPPYGIGWEPRRRSKQGVRRALGCEFPDIVGDDSPFDPSPLIACGKPTVLFGGNHFSDRLPPSPAWIVWDKRIGMNSTDQSDCEMAWSNVGGRARMIRYQFNGGLAIAKENGVLTGSGRPVGLHPTQKPVAVMRQIIEWMPDGVVLDPYAGSGSTLVAAKEAGRSAIGIEIEERYCEIAAKRLAQEVMPL